MPFPSKWVSIPLCFKISTKVFAHFCLGWMIKICCSGCLWTKVITAPSFAEAFAIILRRFTALSSHFSARSLCSGSCNKLSASFLDEILELSRTFSAFSSSLFSLSVSSTVIFIYCGASSSVSSSSKGSLSKSNFSLSS